MRWFAVKAECTFQIYANDAAAAKSKLRRYYAAGEHVNLGILKLRILDVSPATKED